MAGIIFPDKPEIRAGFIAHVCVEFGERCKPELNTLVVKVSGLPAARITALALLPLIGVICRGLAFDSALAVFDCGSACFPIETAARLD